MKHERSLAKGASCSSGSAESRWCVPISISRVEDHGSRANAEYIEGHAERRYVRVSSHPTTNQVAGEAHNTERRAHPDQDA